MKKKYEATHPKPEQAQLELLDAINRLIRCRTYLKKEYFLDDYSESAVFEFPNGSYLTSEDFSNAFNKNNLLEKIIKENAIPSTGFNDKIIMSNSLELDYFRYYKYVVDLIIYKNPKKFNILPKFLKKDIPTTYSLKYTLNLEKELIAVMDITQFYIYVRNLDLFASGRMKYKKVSSAKSTAKHYTQPAKVKNIFAPAEPLQDPWAVNIPKLEDLKNKQTNQIKQRKQLLTTQK